MKILIVTAVLAVLATSNAIPGILDGLGGGGVGGGVVDKITGAVGQLTNLIDKCPDSQYKSALCKMCPKCKDSIENHHCGSKHKSVYMNECMKKCLDDHNGIKQGCHVKKDTCNPINEILNIESSFVKMLCDLLRILNEKDGDKTPHHNPTPKTHHHHTEPAPSHDHQPPKPIHKPTEKCPCPKTKPGCCCYCYPCPETHTTEPSAECDPTSSETPPSSESNCDDDGQSPSNESCDDDKKSSSSEDCD